MKMTMVLLLLTTAAPAQDTAQKARARVFVTDRDSYKQSTSLSASGDASSVEVQAGVRRTNSEQIKTLSRECPGVIITSNREKADFVVAWDSKTWKETSWSGKMNEYVVYNKDGDLVTS